MPTIIYGTAWKKSLTADYVEQALNAGFRGIDTACQPKHYNEPGVGEGIAAFLSKSDLSRNDLYVQTKFTPLPGQDPKQVPYDARASIDEQVRQSIQASLRNLQTNHLDCLVLHSPVDEKRALPIVWSTMELHVDSGHIKQLGISNCYDLGYLERLHRSARIKPIVVQNRFYKDSGYDKSLRAFCGERGIVYQSFWTLTANPHILKHSTVVGLAKQYHRTTAQVFFRYLTQQNIVPLTGTTSAQHMREDLDIFSFELTADECDQISALL